MIRSIVVGASVVHWIETEPRGDRDYHQSLVFSRGGTLHLTAVVTRLLRMASEQRGVWRDPAAIAAPSDPEGGVGVARAALWDHKRAGATAAAVGGAASDAFYKRAVAPAAVREAARA